MLLMEQEKLLDLGSRQPNWVASLLFEKQRNSLLLFLGIGYYTWPANPLEVYEVFLSELEN